MDVQEHALALCNSVIVHYYPSARMAIAILKKHSFRTSTGDKRGSHPKGKHENTKERKREIRSVGDGQFFSAFRDFVLSCLRVCVDMSIAVAEAKLESP